MGHALEPAVPTAPARAPKRLLALRGDTHLAERLRAGDEAAFEVLYDRYSAPLLSFCRHMLGRLDEAEDALQMVFAAAHGDLQRNQRPLDLKPWLYAIARNRCLTMLRARREHPEPEVELVAAGLQDQVQERADLRELVADLGDLPDNQRAALLLTELDDLSHAQVAAVLDCETSQVKGLVFRAREGLIERRDARSAPCEEIRTELASARRGGLRRGRLRHHLAQCPGCAAYLEDVRRQRKMMVLILPVIPATGLKRSVLAAVGIGAGASGTGGLTMAGGSLLTATVAKVALVGALAGGAGVAGVQIVEHRDAAPAGDAPAATVRPAPVRPMAGPAPAAREPRSRPASGPPAAAKPGSQTTSKRGSGRSRGRGSAQGQSRSNRGASPPGLAKQNGVAQKNVPRRPVAPPGQTGKTPASGRKTPARGAPAPAPRAGPKTKLPKAVKQQ